MSLFQDNGIQGAERLGHEAQKDIYEARKRDFARSRLAQRKRDEAWIRGGEIVDRLEVKRKRREEEGNRRLRHQGEDPIMNKTIKMLKANGTINRMVL